MLAATLILAAALDVPPTVTKVLDEGSFEGTPAGFRVIALSHVADGCAARLDDDAGAARACVEKAFARSRATKPKALDVDAGRDGLWLAHVALILGAGDRTGPCLDDALHHQIARALARSSLQDPLGHAPSYGHKPERWPADQAAVLAALRRHDDAHGTHLVDAPLVRYRETMRDRIDESTLLPWSEARGIGTGKLPRGCAIAWSIRYLVEVDDALASSWWTAFRARYLVDRGMLVGFREWPPGVDRPADVDSGPIVAGVGAAATAFSLSAARVMGDDALADRLEATADIVEGMASLDARTSAVARSTLAEAIRFHAARAGRR